MTNTVWNLEFDCQLRANLFYYMLCLETLESFWHIQRTLWETYQNYWSKTEGHSSTLETNMLYNKDKSTKALWCCEVTGETHRILIAKMSKQWLGTKQEMWLIRCLCQITGFILELQLWTESKASIIIQRMTKSIQFSADWWIH